MSQRNHLRDSIKVIVETLWEAERYDEAIVCSKKMCDAYADLNKGVNMGAADTVAYYAQDNGILTAREISLLNLTGLELAVLSACETARGDISGDGVFGLQRGFKKAGTQSLMMSLIKVDDDATRLFMQTFYDYLFSDGRGNVSKYDALLAAINRVRKESKGKWSDKEFRAPFILLDAID